MAQAAEILNLISQVKYLVSTLCSASCCTRILTCNSSNSCTALSAAYNHGKVEAWLSLAVPVYLASTCVAVSSITKITHDPPQTLATHFLLDLTGCIWLSLTNQPTNQSTNLGAFAAV
jgi:hypothetical protein